MEIALGFLNQFVLQLQTPTVAFLLGAFVFSLGGSKLHIPNQVYQLTVFVLLMRMGLAGGSALKEANLTQLLLPALFAALLGFLVVILGLGFFSLSRSVKRADALATAGLFAAVSSGTLFAALLELEKAGVFYEAWVPALYPIMDLPALITAIVLARQGRDSKASSDKFSLAQVMLDTLRSPGFSALLLGLVLGLLSQTQSVYDSFYNLLFPGFITILMVSLGIDAAQRIAELRQVAGWFVVYSLSAPLVHGLMGFGLGYLAHLITGLSPGGVIVLAVITASNSDILGPATIRAGIPEANPSAYVGSSTGIGTPVAVAIGIPLFIQLGRFVFGL